MYIFFNTISDVEMKIWIYWFKSNSSIYFKIYLHKNWKIYWFEQSFTCLGWRTSVHN